MVDNQGKGNEDVEVLLIVAPWGDVESPSIQMSILEPIVKSVGITCHTYYANLDLAQMISPDLYKKFVHNRHLMFLGERLFSEAAFQEDCSIPALEEYLDYINKSAREYLEGYNPYNEEKSQNYLEISFGPDYKNIIDTLIGNIIPKYLSLVRRKLKNITQDLFASHQLLTRTFQALP